MILVGENRTPVLVLLSGGIDSAACLDFYIKEKRDVFSIFVDYGQKAKEQEFISSKKIASHYDVPLTNLEILSSSHFSEGEIMGRNGFLLMLALMYKPIEYGIIAIGIHSGTPYYDCSEGFINEIDRLAENYSCGKIKFEAPFVKWDKRMIVQYCRENDVPLNLTYSCEAGASPPCGKCLSCMDRRALDVR
jgi:7-cyano-7-deazaguanine synthase